MQIHVDGHVINTFLKDNPSPHATWQSLIGRALWLNQSATNTCVWRRNDWWIHTAAFNRVNLDLLACTQRGWNPQSRKGRKQKTKRRERGNEKKKTNTVLTGPSLFRRAWGRMTRQGTVRVREGESGREGRGCRREGCLGRRGRRKRRRGRQNGRRWKGRRWRWWGGWWF